MDSKAFPFIGLLSFFWGTNVVASRFAIGEFEPIQFIALRLMIATICFLPFLFWPSQRGYLKSDTWQKSIISGVLGVSIPMTTFILSLQFLSSGIASIFVTTTPVFIAIAAHFFLEDEKMSHHKMFGIILALLGSLFLVLRGESGLANVERANPLGFGLILIGQLSETTNAIYVRKKMRDLNPVTVTGIRLLTGAVILTVIASLTTGLVPHEISSAGYFSLGYASLIGALGGQFMAFYITRRFGATAFSLNAYLIPIIASGFGVLLLGELITWSMLVGITSIGAGIYLINHRPKPAFNFR